MHRQPNFRRTLKHAIKEDQRNGPHAALELLKSKNINTRLQIESDAKVYSPFLTVLYRVAGCKIGVWNSNQRGYMTGAIQRVAKAARRQGKWLTLEDILFSYMSHQIHPLSSKAVTGYSLENGQLLHEVEFHIIHEDK